MKYIKIEDYPCKVYRDRGRYFVDFGAKGYDKVKKEYYPLPIHSYETWESLMEAIYYYYN